MHDRLHNLKYARRGSGFPIVFAILVVVLLVIVLMLLLFREEMEEDSSAEATRSEARSSQVDQSGLTAEPTPTDSSEPEAGSQEREKETARVSGAAEARQKAQQQYQKSRAHSRSGDHQAAVREAIEAWEIVKRFPDDPACRELTLQIQAELDSLARKANRESGAATRDDSKTLTTN